MIKRNDELFRKDSAGLIPTSSIPKTYLSVLIYHYLYLVTDIWVFPYLLRNLHNIEGTKKKVDWHKRNKGTH